MNRPKPGQMSAALPPPSRNGQFGAGGGLEAEAHPGPYQFPHPGGRLQFPIGGEAEITDWTLVPLNGVQAYRQITWTRDGSDGRPACKIVFEVRDGALILASFALSSTDQIIARAKDLRAFPIEAIRNGVYRYLGVCAPDPNIPGGQAIKVGPNAYKENREHVERGKNTPELREKVVKACANAVDGQRVEAVRNAFPGRKGGRLSERSARRYLEYAGLTP